MSLERAMRVDSRSRTGLGWLLGARLLLAGLSLALAVAIDRIDGGPSTADISGVYWTVVVAFLATIISARMIHRTQDPARFATAQVGIDVTIVTSLVYFSGGGESVFTFLYALVVLYGALVLDRNGVGVTAALAAAGYGLVIFGSEFGWLPSGVESRDRPIHLLAAYWGFYAGALLVLGMLANTLSAELRRTGDALDRQTSDLQRLRDLHLRTVESISSGLLTTDENGAVTSFNPEAERITGLSSEMANGRPLDELIPGAAAILEEVGPLDQEHGDGGRDRLAYRNRRSEALFLGIAASRLRDENGQQVGHVVIFQDVTQVVSMENELRRSERLAAVGEMAARMAHEIRNPLASISGSVQVLRSESGDNPSADPEEDRLMSIVVREVDRLNLLITDFLRYSRPSPLKLVSVSPGKIVQEIADISQAHHEGDELTVELDLDRDLRVMADEDQLKGMVWNLWNNAIEAMEGAGGLSARVFLEAGSATQGQGALDRNREGGGQSHGPPRAHRVVLEIQDTGPGMTPNETEMIFEPFFTTKREGTGLGLATVQRLVEQHGGTIQLASELGVGTCVRVLLDAAESCHE